ncbi:MAG TPA: type II toxin-antitoxin system RelB/DinJ family antitoxin [Candidatus Limnocylindrales bacterium]|nr:type II toxin-antitoxin system RelB/DinJ family antitoxin [Candidatus Limnocylindrales bacterium]
MNTTSIHIKIEADIKAQAQKTAEELGLSLSAVMKALLKQFIRTKHLSVGLSEEPSSYMLEALKKSDKEYKEGKTSPSFTAVEDSFKWLDQ